MSSSESVVRLTRARVRALRILHPVHALDAELFAHYMWPDSPSWRAARPGRGARLKARSFLARLERDGLVIREPGGGGRGYRLSRAGEQLLGRAGAAVPQRVRLHPLDAQAS